MSRRRIDASGVTLRWMRLAALAAVACGWSVSLAAAAPAPHVRFDQTVIPPDVPAQALIGEDLTFRVRFANTPGSGSSVGFGPFVDLVLDAGGPNIGKAASCGCDGLTFVQANMIQVSGGAVPLVSRLSAPCATVGGAATVVPHPFTGISPVTVPPGGQLVTLELPFGSFDPTQPEVVVEVTAHVSNRADANALLSIRARGGFRYGATPGDDAPPDWPVLSDTIAGVPPANQQTSASQWAAAEQTRTTVILARKKYLGPEDETASGPNFVRRYEITVDVASGATVSNVTVTDRIPANMAYHALLPPTPSCFTAIQTPIPDQANPGSANWLAVKCPSLTGAPGADATIVFEFFIPQACDVDSVNDVVVECDWTPVDACDTSPVHVVSDVTAADHTLRDKCITIQKSVVDLTGTGSGHPIPGDTLQYTLEFQLADFKTAGNIRIRDILSDGLTLVPSTVTLTVTDPCGTTTGAVPASARTATTLACTSGAPSPRTQLDLDVSAAMIAIAGTSGPWRHRNGILTGGYATSPSSSVAATGRVTFNAVIADAYQCAPAAPHDAFVDKEDPLTNSVKITAEVLANAPSCAAPSIPAPTGTIVVDESAKEIAIASGTLEKNVYAVKRGSAEVCGPSSAACTTVPDLFPGDLVTFRIRKTIPSGDAESLAIQDWLPQPAFLASAGTFSNTPCGLPAAGSACLGPANTQAVTPAFTTSTSTNSFKFDYGTFNDPANQLRTIDLLYTSAVTTTPFADGLYHSNQAGECESNTFGTTFCQSAIAQVRVRTPALRIMKGVIAATNPNATFSPSLAGAVTFNAPGTTGRRFNGTINSAYLAATPINANVAGVDANDCVTFAVVVENRGGSAAFDVKLEDLFPVDSLGNPECFDPNFGTLTVTDGAGTPVPFTQGSGFLNGVDPITLTNPIPAAGTSGANVVVLTFDACVVKNLKPRCCDNTAKIARYAAAAGATNYAPSGLAGPMQDVAQLCVLPRASKRLVTTSEAHTPGTPSGTPIDPEKVAIGEIVRYRLEIAVPESAAPANYEIQEFLPAGLAFLPASLTAVTGLNAPTTVAKPLPDVTGGPFTCSVGSPRFDFGAVTNTHSDAAPEIIAIEFNALVCNAAAVQNGTALNNSFAVYVDGQLLATSNSVAAVVVEPNIAVAKSASVANLAVGATVSYTITATNNGAATAYDVRLTDVLPSCLGNASQPVITTVGTIAGLANTFAAHAPVTLSIDSMPAGASLTIVYTAPVTCLDCGNLLNTAVATWTSLPGPSGTTTNPTLSSTPGLAGASNGERNSSGNQNDYVASSTVRLCCMNVSNATTSCGTAAPFTHSFDVTNHSGANVTSIVLTPVSSSNTSISPSTFSTPLAPGATASIAATFSGSGPAAGASTCFFVDLMSSSGSVCRTQQCFTPAICCATPPSGMVAWYPLDELAGATSFVDVAPQPASAVNNAGTPVPASVGPFPVKPVTGKVGGAIYFAPSASSPFNGRVEVPSQAELLFGGQSFTVDAWVRAVQCGAGFPSPVVDKLDVGLGFALLLRSTSPGVDVLELHLNNSTFTSSGTLSATANPIQNTGPWVHVAVSVDAATSTGRFFIDGAPAGTFTSTGPANNLLPMWIGQTRLAGGRCEIAIDELEVFNRAVPQAELAAIFQAGAAGKCRPQLPAIGSLCVVKFEDLDKDGVADPAESYLAGWTFDVRDPSNALVGSIVSAASAGGAAVPVCLTLPAGSYTVTEQLQGGWSPTTPNPQTVTLSGGQTTTVSFGNRRGRRRAVRH